MFIRYFVFLMFSDNVTTLLAKHILICHPVISTSLPHVYNKCQIRNGENSNIDIYMHSFLYSYFQ